MDRREWLNDPQESYQIAFDYFQSQMWTAIPAVVVSVDLEKQTISAQSSIKGEFKNKEGVVSYINMPLFQDVVLCMPRAGGYIVSFPVKPGDEVLIVFASRCIDGWWQSGGENNIAPEFRMHDLSDSFAILAPTSQPKAVSGLPANAFRIMNEEATKYVEISEDKITVESDGDVEVYGQNVQVNAANTATVSAVNINLTADTSVSITAPDIYLNGTVHP